MRFHVSLLIYSFIKKNDEKNTHSFNNYTAVAGRNRSKAKVQTCVEREFQRKRAA